MTLCLIRGQKLSTLCCLYWAHSKLRRGLGCDMVDHWWSLMNGQMTPNCVVARQPDGRAGHHQYYQSAPLAHNKNLNTTFKCCMYHNLGVYQVKLISTMGPHHRQSTSWFTIQALISLTHLDLVCLNQV